MTAEPSIKKGDYIVTLASPPDDRTRVEDCQWSLVGTASREIKYTHGGVLRLLPLPSLDRPAWKYTDKSEDPLCTDVLTALVRPMPQIVCDGVPRTHIVEIVDYDVFEVRMLLRRNHIVHSATSERIFQFMQALGLENRDYLDRDFLFGLAESLRKLPPEEIAPTAYFFDQLLQALRDPFYNRGR